MRNKKVQSLCASFGKPEFAWGTLTQLGSAICCQSNSLTKPNLRLSDNRSAHMLTPVMGLVLVMLLTLTIVPNTAFSAGEILSVAGSDDAPATVGVNDGDDVSVVEADITEGVIVTFTTPADSVAGDTLDVDTNGDGVADQTITLTVLQAGGGTVEMTVDPSHVATDGSLKVMVVVPLM